MLSVENFNWVLFENLLKPVGLDCWYYYPFGTKQNLSIGEFDPTRAKKYRTFCTHVLFHYDQEPLWSGDFGAYDCISHAWGTKIARILANSEHSMIKKNICKSRGMIDWYYFYHGFAALDWFQDSQYLGDSQCFTKSFCSFNHLVRDKKSYRMALTSRLVDLGIDSEGLISFHGSAEDCSAEIQQDHSPVPQAYRSLIRRHLCGDRRLPWTLDSESLDGNFSAHLGHREYRLWQNYFLHLVNETVFYDSKLHLTEKIFKPIVALRPFVLAAAPGNLQYLRSYGFRTFEPWIDESYDKIIDPAQRLDMISHEVAKFYRKSLTELQDIYTQMRPILEHNKRHFFGEFRRIITNELVDNFDQCVRTWNNGRVDDRQLPLHPDLEAVKQILLR